MRMETRRFVVTLIALAISAVAAGGVGWIEHPPDTQFRGGVSVTAGYINADSYPDIVATADVDNQVVWYENDGSGIFTRHVIADNYACAVTVHAADVDGDGDIDVSGRRMNPLSLRPGVYSLPGDGEVTDKAVRVR